MTQTLAYRDIDTGTTLPEREFTVLLDDLVRYCGASSDFVGIHWNQRVATSVGLPDVIAHGALTLAHALTTVTDWVGDAAAVTEYQVRFSRPVVVPDDGKGATLHITGAVEEKLADHRLSVRVEVRCGTDEVLTGLLVTVKLS